MKTLRRISVASVFVFVLAFPTFAGQIDTMVAPPPPQATTTATTNGQIDTTLTGQDETGSGEASATDSATAAVLNLVQSVLALF